MYVGSAAFGDSSVQNSRDRPQASIIRAHVGGVLNRKRVDQKVWQLNVERVKDAVRGGLIAAVLILQFHQLQFGLPDIVVSPTGRRELIPVSLEFHSTDACPPHLETSPLAGFADII